MAVRAAVPGGPVDWQLWMDEAQHAGRRMIRWLELDVLAAGKKKA